MLPRLLLAGFLLGHAAIHAGFLSPRPPDTVTGPPWPFDLGRSWLLTPIGAPPEALRAVGIALFAATLVGFSLAALAALGFLPVTLWQWGTVIGAAASLAMLVVFFHPWLLVGIAIDLVALWAVIGGGWSPTGTTPG
ncbi:MAG: hypothetical protein ACXWXA_10765 [Candidatus Limnocylindrales bacterium]